MMWTIVAPEMWNGETNGADEKEEVICYGGIQLAVAKEAAGGYRVRRVLSTDPADFLCEGISPGAIIRR